MPVWRSIARHLKTVPTRLLLNYPKGDTTVNQTRKSSSGPAITPVRHEQLKRRWESVNKWLVNIIAVYIVIGVAFVVLRAVDSGVSPSKVTQSDLAILALIFVGIAVALIPVIITAKVKLRRLKKSDTTTR